MANRGMIAVVVFVVILFNNYVYIHDIVWDKYVVVPTDQTALPPGNYITLGTKSIIAIIGSIVIAGFCLFMSSRSPKDSPAAAS